jgi:hypothetical protein
MIVLIPTNTTHTITFIPRFVPSEELTLQLYKEETQQFENKTNTYIYANGLLTIDFPLNCFENDKFQLIILNDTEVIYRDKIFVTAQDTQEYKATKDHYYYE